MTVKVGILGASGYGGSELIRRLSRHNQVQLTGFASRQYLGQPLEACWPQLAGLPLGSRIFEDNETVIAGADVLFFATPHAATAPLVAQAIAQGKQAIDLSADFRLDADTYAEWYGLEHPQPELIAQARYGLVELHRQELPGARIVASPGCNATAASLALAPLAASGHLGTDVSVTIATGISGAGRAAKPVLHFPEAQDSVVPYSTGGRHRHVAEIEATLGRIKAATAGGDFGAGRNLSTHGQQQPPTLTFTPMRVPMVRGILAVASTRSPAGTPTTAELLGLYRDYYAGNPLLHVQDSAPETKAVAGTDRAIISVEADRRSGMIQAYTVLDNLGKGASGQAVQGFNVANGFEETAGLELEGRWP